MKYLIVLCGILLGGCSLLSPVNTAPSEAALAQRQADSVVQLRQRIQYGNWLLASHAPQREQERLRLSKAQDLNSRISLALVNSHPAEGQARRKGALASLEKLLPEVGLDEQAYLRSWLQLSRLGTRQVTGLSPQEGARLRARIRDLEEKIARLSAIDEQINQRRLP